MMRDSERGPYEAYTQVSNLVTAVESLIEMDSELAESAILAFYDEDQYEKDMDVADRLLQLLLEKVRED